MAVGVILDNGGGFIKAAKTSLRRDVKSEESSLSALSAVVAPNALAKPAKNALPIAPEHVGRSRRPFGFLVAGEIDHAPDLSAMTFRRPIDRGAVTLWDAQRDVWASVFSADCGIGLDNAAEAALIVTEPLGVPMHMRFAMDELVFEEFGFAQYTAVNPQRLAAAGARRSTALVLDSGFSFTHAVPVVDGTEIASSSRRLNLGGKALTNYLKEMVSFRSWNMMDETAVINAVKERLCYVSLSYYDELGTLKTSKNPIVQEYALPDFSRGCSDPLGHVLSADEERDGTEQVLVMNNERISVPEILFNPSDVGMGQAGIAELIFQAVEASPKSYHADLYANIVLTGGNCRIPNFRERVIKELRPLVCDNYDVNVYMDEDPMLTTFNGGVRAFADDTVPLQLVSKSFYSENGSSGVIRKLLGDDSEGS